MTSPPWIWSGTVKGVTPEELEACGAQIVLANTFHLMLRPGAEVVLTALPLYHIFAFTVNLLAFYATGGRNVLIPSPRPPSNLKRAFENYRITWLTGVNTLFNALLNERWFVEHPPRSLRASVAGGMALHAAVAARWQEVTGTPVVEGYGLTEASPVVSAHRLSGVRKLGSVGQPISGVTARILDDDDRERPVGEVGEVCVRGPNVMLGYYGLPEETARTLRGGWLHTGDMGRLDADGYLYIVERKKDLIIRGGFNIYPRDVEEVLYGHPSVLECAVVGVPDAKMGEEVRAYVVVRPGEQVTAQELLDHACAQLARFKTPKDVVFLDVLPKNPIGKILKKDLREMAKQNSAI